MATLVHLPLNALPFVDMGPTGHSVTNDGVTLDVANGKFGAGARFTRADLDRLWMADHADWRFGATNWTIHFWIYIHSHTNDDGLCGSLEYGDNADGMAFNLGTSGAGEHVRYYSGGYRIETVDVTLTSLIHLALVRDSTYVKIYEDGTLMTTGTWTHSNAAVPDMQLGFSIGSFWGDNTESACDATISEFIIDDTALWTTNFTPPTAPLIATGGHSRMTAARSLLRRRR